MKIMLEQVQVVSNTTTKNVLRITTAVEEKIFYVATYIVNLHIHIYSVRGKNDDSSRLFHQIVKFEKKINFPRKMPVKLIILTSLDIIYSYFQKMFKEKRKKLTLKRFFDRSASLSVLQSLKLLF